MGLALRGGGVQDRKGRHTGAPVPPSGRRRASLCLDGQAPPQWSLTPTGPKADRAARWLEQRRSDGARSAETANRFQEGERGPQPQGGRVPAPGSSPGGRTQVRSGTPPGPGPAATTSTFSGNGSFSGYNISFSFKNKMAPFKNYKCKSRHIVT